LGFLPSLFFVSFLAENLAAQALFVKPVKVLGDPHFIGTAGNPLAVDSTGPNVVEGREFNAPAGIAVDNSTSPPIIYIADNGNSRILAYQYNTQLTPGGEADLVLGQQDSFTNLAQGPSGTLSTGLKSPTGLAVDASGNLYVADTGDNRILRYPRPFSQPAGYQFPNMIIGQATFSGSTANTGGVKGTTLSLGGHTGLAFDSAGNLWVSDTGNNRVLRYPVSALQSGQNGPAADIVLGQTDLVSNLAATLSTSKSGLFHPSSVAFDPAGRMLVADSLTRVVVYPSSPASSTPALRILGIDTSQNAARLSATAVGGPLTAVATGSNIVVMDTAANRMLVYASIDSWPNELTQFSPTAVAVVGQNTFTDFKANQGGEPSATTVSAPLDAALGGGELFVADSSNNRVLVYSSNPGGLTSAAQRVIGQLDFPDNAPNLTEGREFNLSGNLNSGISGSAILDINSTPHHLYVADSGNNRILGFSDFQHAISGQKADIVIGQPDFSRTTINYPSGDLTAPNQQGLSGPTSLALDSAGNLYVADTFNSRILRFPAPFASGTKTLESADLVIGQSSFTSTVTDPTERTMAAPIALAFTREGADNSNSSGYLLAVDVNHNRVLFFPKPFSTGMSATKVIGQPSFNSTDTSADVTRLKSPRGVAVDPNNHVLVADTGNSRVQVFDTVQNLPVAFATPSFSLAANLSGPVGIAMAQNGQFWIVNPGGNNLLHYPPVDQLPLKNYAADASQPAISPRSGFVDSYSNLLVTDGVNRLLYFAPGLGVVNAANYITGRPLAPGTFAAVFPAGGSTNVLATGTASAPSGVFPLPITLSDTQVLVNNNTASLFYVSPGQINFPLSLTLPTAGTVDLQVVSQSTGQVYGGAEVALNSASPGLFTLGGSGSAGVAAENQDGSINAPNNAIPRGSVVVLFGTGEGPVANPPTEGFGAPAGLTPTASHPQILLGSPSSAIVVPDANIQYSGLAPTLVGVWQINFLVPSNAPSGNSVPIKVLMNSIPSDNPAVPGQIAATIAIK
jgi:uncharacterized protein (TIGR03437 family)